MSLLGDFIPDTTLTHIQHAIIDATCLAIAADGRITCDESQHAVESIAALLECDATQAAMLVQKSFARIEGDAHSVLQELGDRVTSSQEIEAVFMAAAFVAFQGGGMYLDEEVFMLRLANVLNLPPEDTSYLMDLAKERLDDMPPPQA